MKNFLLILLSIVAVPSYGENYFDFYFDLTDPENMALAEIIPAYDLVTTFTKENTGSISYHTVLFKDESNMDNIDFFVSTYALFQNYGPMFTFYTSQLECSDIKDKKINIETNDREVIYSVLCMDEGNTSLIPYSKADHNYLVEEFKKENAVVFKHTLLPATITYPIDFTNKWNSLGGSNL